MMLVRLLLSLVLASAALPAATKLMVTVIEQKSGKPVTGLQAGDFNVFDDKTPLRVESSEAVRGLVDIMLLLDTSLMGGAVQPVAENLISQLQPKEQMAVVAFHSSADLIQDFTSSRQLLLQSIAKVKYGNAPHLLDALFAAIDGGFQSTTFRRVILLLTAGVEGPSRSSEKEVIKLARRNQVSIFPVYATGREKWMFELLARQTGGASFNLRDMKKAGTDQPGPRVFEVLRTHYLVTVATNLSLGDRLKVEIKRPEKLLVSALATE
jgi:VWFA-related protein